MHFGGVRCAGGSHSQDSSDICNGIMVLLLSSQSPWHDATWHDPKGFLGSSSSPTSRLSSCPVHPSSQNKEHCVCPAAIALSWVTDMGRLWEHMLLYWQEGTALLCGASGCWWYYLLIKVTYLLCSITYSGPKWKQSFGQIKYDITIEWAIIQPQQWMKYWYMLPQIVWSYLYEMSTIGKSRDKT